MLEALSPERRREIEALIADHPGAVAQIRAIRAAYKVSLITAKEWLHKARTRSDQSLDEYHEQFVQELEQNE